MLLLFVTVCVDKQSVLAFADVRKLPSLAKALKAVDRERFTTVVYWGKEDKAALEVRFLGGGRVV